MIYLLFGNKIILPQVKNILKYDKAAPFSLGYKFKYKGIDREFQFFFLEGSDVGK